jgi:uncharacterized damage-inducible protein DinB
MEDPNIKFFGPVHFMISLNEFFEEWRWARGLSIGLLEALPEALLTAKPVAISGAWWKQFRHLARVQENYVRALETGSIHFTCERSLYTGGANRESLLTYLKEADQKLFSNLSGLSAEIQIDWFGTSISLQQHLVRLLSHETLHHGQFIIYARQVGLKLPECWGAWGE